MSNYSMNQQSASTTAVKLIDGAFTNDEALRILVTLGQGSVECRLGLSSVQASSGIKVSEMSSSPCPLEFILPAGEDLWAVTDSGTATLNLIVTQA